MNVHGVMVPNVERERISRKAVYTGRIRNFWDRYRAFLLIVVAPVLLVSGYYYLIASDQYESEAHFIVRTTNDQQMAGIGISQALTAATGLGAAQSESMSVADYLTSHDVVDTLNKTNLTALFQRDGVDPLSRLLGSNPPPERLLKYFRRQVSVKYNSETGITTLNVHLFSPRDSYNLVEDLLRLGEQRVNVLNERSYNDSIALARRQLAQTEEMLQANQAQLKSFRQTRRDIDPQASGTAQIGLVSRLSEDLSAARAQLAAMGAIINHSSPQYVALASRVRALESQLGAQSGKLTSGSTAIAADIGGYETLRMRQEFLTKRYEAAAVSLDKAREQAQRQQLYLVRVVEPNMPVKSLYPERARIVLTVLAALLLVYAVGWLIVAGMREHAA